MISVQCHPDRRPSPLLTEETIRLAFERRTEGAPVWDDKTHAGMWPGYQDVCYHMLTEESSFCSCFSEELAWRHGETYLGVNGRGYGRFNRRTKKS